jgi:hypothetical protein
VIRAVRPGIGHLHGARSPFDVHTTEKSFWPCSGTASAPRTPGAGQTVVAQETDPVGDTYWVQSTDAPTPAAGTKVTINDTAPTRDRWDLALVAIS